MPACLFRLPGAAPSVGSRPSGPIHPLPSTLSPSHRNGRTATLRFPAGICSKRRWPYIPASPVVNAAPCRLNSGVRQFRSASAVRLLGQELPLIPVGSDRRVVLPVLQNAGHPDRARAAVCRAGTPVTVMFGDRHRDLRDAHNLPNPPGQPSPGAAANRAAAHEGQCPPPCLSGSRPCIKSDRVDQATTRPRPESPAADFATALQTASPTTAASTVPRVCAPTGFQIPIRVTRPPQRGPRLDQLLTSDRPTQPTPHYEGRNRVIVGHHSTLTTNHNVKPLTRKRKNPASYPHQTRTHKTILNPLTVLHVVNTTPVWTRINVCLAGVLGSNRNLSCTNLRCSPADSRRTAPGPLGGKAPGTPGNPDGFRRANEIGNGLSITSIPPISSVARFMRLGAASRGHHV